MTPADLRRWHDANSLTYDQGAAALAVSRRYYTYLLAGKTSLGAKIDTIPRRIELAWREAARQIEKKRMDAKNSVDTGH